VPRSRVNRVQDSVHGLMEFRDTEAVVIDLLRTVEVSRLRRVKQMGLAEYVFPAAEHSRFAHSLGAAYVAIRFARQLHEAASDYLTDWLLPDPSSIRDLAVAALCHDIGHGPLSHQWEREVIGEGFDRDAWSAALHVSLDDAKRLHSHKWHELVGFALLGWEDGQLHQLLEEHEAGLSRRIQEMLLGEHYVPYLPQLLSNDVDVDRADFILRDAKQTGVGYGLYDLNWLASTSTLGTNAEGRVVVGFDVKKAPRVIEQFLLARRAQYDTVYQHRTIRSAEGMAALFLRRMKEVALASPDEFKHLPQPMRDIVSGATLDPSQVLSIDDQTFWGLAGHAAQPGFSDRTGQDLAQRLLARNLFKQVPCSSHALKRFRMEHDVSVLEDAIKKHCPGEPKFYYLYEEAFCQLVSKAPSQFAYFVDADHVATPIAEHDVMKPHLLGEPDEDSAPMRLFCIPEAIKTVVELVN